MILIGNWKSHKNSEEVATWLQSFSEQSTALLSDVEIVLAPADVHIDQVSRSIADQLHKRVSLAAQDVSPFPTGSYTGATAASMLEGFGVAYAVLGHSERRRYFKETPTDIAQKVARCLESSITPVVCVDSDTYEDQARVLSSEALEKAIIAFEPAAAIGSGSPEDPEVVRDMIASIRLVYGENTRCLYGGSITNVTVHDYTDFCDGFIVGGASLDPESFATLILALS